MVLLLLFVIILIAIVLSSAKIPDSHNPIESTDSEANNNRRVKRTTADNASAKMVQQYRDKLATFHHMIEENAQNNLNACTALEHKINSAIATLTGQMSSIEQHMLPHTLEAMACRLRVSSQSFGEKYPH